MKKNIFTLIIAIILAFGIIIGFYYWKKKTESLKTIPLPVSTPTITPTDNSSPEPTIQIDNTATNDTLIDDSISEIEKDLSNTNPEEDFKMFSDSEIGL